MRWDKKSKKYVRVGDNDKKKIKTESGAYISATYKTNRLVALFLAGNQLYDWFTHRGGCQKILKKICQKKSIDVFIHKQRHLNLAPCAQAREHKHRYQR